MVTEPLVSILVPVYNAVAFLPGLLASVRAQTYKNWELICVDDLSADSSSALLEAAAGDDNRIRLFRNVKNIGPSATLNRAAAAARGDLLARLDADDTMVPERLGLQIAYLSRHQRVGLLGSYYRNIEPNGSIGKVEGAPLESGDALRAAFLFFNPLGHSTVMFRRGDFERVGGYDENLRASLDYDLLARLSRVTATALLPKALVNYRTHGDNITTRSGDLQLENAKTVQRDLLSFYGFTFDEAQLALHYRIHLYRGLATGATDGHLLLESRKWLKELARQNLAHHIFEPVAFAATLREVHTGLYARKTSTLRLSDYLRNFTAGFGSLRPRQLVRQLGHSLKNGL